METDTHRTCARERRFTNQSMRENQRAALRRAPRALRERHTSAGTRRVPLQQVGNHRPVCQLVPEGRQCLTIGPRHWRFPGIPNDRRYKLEPGTGHEGCPPLLGRAECHDDAVVARIQGLVNTVLKSVALERELAHLQRYGTASKAEMIRDLERQYPGLPLRVHRLDDLG